jgi:hypothetical protein
MPPSLSYAEFIAIFPEFLGEITQARFAFFATGLLCQYDCMGLGECGSPDFSFALLTAHYFWMMCRQNGQVRSYKNASSEEVFQSTVSGLDDVSLGLSPYGRMLLDQKMLCYKGVVVTCDGC